MRTAIDTNVLIDVLARAGRASHEAREALLIAGAAGELILSIICYAEIAHRFSSKKSFDDFMSGMQLEVSGLNEGHAYTAGKFYEAYRARGGTRQRILPDFLVGSHALLEADRLLTLDGRFYGPGFPELKAVSPVQILAGSH